MSRRADVMSIIKKLKEKDVLLIGA